MTTPDTIGPQHPKAADGTDPRGWLVFEHLPDDLQRAEDSRQAADHEWFHGALSHRLDDLTGTLAPHLPRGHSWWRRPATPTERLLLEHLGYQLPADEPLLTYVEYLTNGVRRRRWLQLEDQTPNPTTEGE